jgi:hypothetical protein
MTASSVPQDFPREVPMGAVPGAQPKLLVRQEAGQFVATEPSDEEVQGRHELCEDLVQQLLRYRARKQAERPDWTPAQVREKTAAGVRRKSFGWGLSPAETEWILRRLVAEDAGAAPTEGATT